MSEHKGNFPTISFSQEDVTLIKKETLYAGFIDMHQYTLRHRLFQGTYSEPIERVCVSREQAVGVLPYDPVNDKVLLIEQFRVGLVNSHAPWQFEIVAGLMDSGETAEAVAKRELKEETGCVAKNLYPLYDYWTSPGGSDEHVTLYCAHIDSEHCLAYAGLASESEDIKTHLVSCGSAFDMLKTGNIKNALAIISLQWLAANKQILQQQWVG